MMDKIDRLALLALTACLSSCGSLGAKNENLKQQAEIHLQLGVRYMDLNKLEIAKENLLLSVDEDSSNPQTHNALAFLYERLHQYDEAEEEYDTALDIKPDDFGIQNNYGRYLCEHENAEEGMKLLMAAVNNPLNDRKWMALTNAGRCLQSQGKGQESESYFRQTLEVKNDYAPALSAMQKISYQKKDFWAAKGYLDRYLIVAAPTLETLYLAILTERALNHTDRAKEYEQTLLEKFPASSEAKKIRSHYP
ncbi:MAG: type IV pilus biogenesis/stability protein PilW [Gammaproteobacteria bacterium]